MNTQNTAGIDEVIFSDELPKNFIELLTKEYEDGEQALLNQILHYQIMNGEKTIDYKNKKVLVSKNIMGHSYDIFELSEFPKAYICVMSFTKNDSVLKRMIILYNFKAGVIDHLARAENNVLGMIGNMEQHVKESSLPTVVN